MSNTPHDDKLHAALLTFVSEAIPFLRKSTDVKSIPKVTRFKLSDVQGQKNIIKADGPNWWQVSSYMKPVLEQSSFKLAVIACSEHPLIRSRNGKRADALNMGSPLFFNFIPEQFLTECIAREDGLTFRRRTFECVYCDLFNFLMPTAKNKAHLIAPLDNVQLEANEIILSSNARIKSLTAPEIISTVNHCPILRHFYGHGSHLWFNAVFELDFNFEWQWSDMDEHGHSISGAIVQSSEPALVNILMEELLLLRSLLGKPLCSPTYVTDYGN